MSVKEAMRPTSGLGAEVTLDEVVDAVGRFPTIHPHATLVDAWGLMSEEGLTHLPVVADGHVVGMLSLVVTFSEFPQRSPAAGFWPH
jgi:CBS domain-containing protein